MTIAFALAIFVVLLLLLVPVAVALGATTILTMLLFQPLPLPLFGQKFYSNLDKFPLMAVAFFLLAATVMEKGGIVRRLIDLANALVGSLRGGLGIASILSCVLFAAISGSSSATVAGVGGIMFPALKAAGYSERYAVGAITTAGAIGILIPPSIPLILYGLVTNTSVVDLFLAGIVPGILYGGMLMVLAFALARRIPVPDGGIASFGDRLRKTRRGLPALLVPAALFVGIYGLPPIEALGFEGEAIFTPTEAAIACVGIAMLVSVLAFEGLRWRDLNEIATTTMPRCGMLFLLITNAVLFGYLLQQQGIPDLIAGTVAAWELPKWAFLIIINIAFILAGFFLDGVPIILMLVPVLLPAATAVGIDPVQFGIIVVVNIEMGTVTPPVGVNLYVASAMTGLPIQKVFAACLPWLAVNFVMLIVVSYLPIVSLWLPGR